MPDRNPFEETMRAGQMNVPQRTVRPTMRDVAGPVRTHEAAHQGVRTGFGGGPIGYYEDPTGPTRPPGQPMSGRHIGYGGPQPVRSGFGGGSNMYYEDPAMGSGDTLGALLGGLDREQEEGIGEYAGGPGMQNVRVEGNLWKQAHANVAKNIGVSAGEVSGKASQGAIQREFKRLKEIFYSKKYGTGIMKGIGKGSPLGMMMELMPLDPALESIGEVLDPEAPGWV